MSIKKSLLAVVAISVVSVGMVSCGGSKTQAPPPAPVEQEQAATLSFGVKREKEECEAMAMESGAIRAFANAVSQNEQHGTRTATNSARAELARMLEIIVNGMDRGFSQEHTSDQDASSYAGKSTSLEQGFFSQTISGSRVVCKNTYVQPDGRFSVYVAVEMDERGKEAMFRQLKEKEKIAIDFAEDRFIKEFEEAREKYLNER